MSYVVGNWSIDVQTTDTITSTKNLPIPDLDYGHDFVVSSRKPEELHLYNSTGAALRPGEKLRFTRRLINDVYASGLSAQLDVCGGQHLTCANGVSAYGEIAYLLKATNTVSGEEIVFPMRGGLSFTVPTADIVPQAALLDLVKRTVSIMFATGSVDGTQVTHIARGDLDPTE